MLLQREMLGRQEGDARAKTFQTKKNGTSKKQKAKEL